MRLYRLMLLLYPGAFRERFGDEMIATFGDMVDRRSGSWFNFWLAIVTDLIAGIWRERTVEMKQTTMLCLGGACLTGLAIAWVDSRPSWDDTGITAAALLVSSAMVGALAPARPWRWALAIGAWIPLNGLIHHNPSTLMVLAVTFAGAYAGSAIRRVVAPPSAPAGDSL